MFGICQYMFPPSCLSLEPRAPTETQNIDKRVQRSLRANVI